MLASERDHPKQEMDFVVGQTQILEKEKNALSQELKEKAELQKFFALEIKILSEELETLKAERDDLGFNKEAGHETLRYPCRVTSLIEERDQLLDTVEELRRDKIQLKTELEENAEMKRHLAEKLHRVEAERDVLLAQRESRRRGAADEVEKLTCSVRSLTEERAQLQETLERRNQEKNQLAVKLEDVAETFQAELLCLVEKIKGIEAEQESRCQSSFEELERLNCVVRSLTEEHAQLEKIFDELEWVTKQLETELQDTVQQLEEQLNRLKENETVVQAEAIASQQALSKHLEEAQQKNDSCISGYKMDIRRLHTELEASRLQVEDLNNAIKTLKSQLQKSEWRCRRCLSVSVGAAGWMAAEVEDEERGASAYLEPRVVPWN